MLRVSAAALAIICSSSCAQVLPSAGSEVISCPVTDSKGWAAWINAMPGPDAKAKLIVTGEVTVPAGGYSAQMRLGSLAEAPSQEVLLELTRVQGGANSAFTTLKVRGDFAALPSYESVTVKCGNRILAEIAPVDRVY